MDRSPSSSAGGRPPTSRCSTPTCRAITPRSDDRRRQLRPARPRRPGSAPSSTTSRITEHSAAAWRRDPAGPPRRRRDRVPAADDDGESGSVALVVRGQRLRPDGRHPGRAAGARLRPRARGGADARASTPRSTPRAPNAASSCWPTTQGTLEFKTARGRGQVTPARARRSPPARRFPREVFETGKSQHRRRSARRQPRRRSRRHDRHRHPSRAVRAAARRRDSGRGAGRVRAAASIGVLYLDGRERSTMRRPRRAARSRPLPRRRRWRSRARGSTPSRPRRRASSATCASPPTSSGRCCPKPNYDSPVCDVAAASVPCRTVGGDFFDYLQVRDGRVRVRPRRRGGQGAAGGDPRRRRPEQLRRPRPQSARDPAQTMSRINTALLRRAIEARFATMCYGVLAPDGTLQSCNAGQEPPLVIGASGMRWLEDRRARAGAPGRRSATSSRPCSSSPATSWWSAATV